MTAEIVIYGGTAAGVTAAVQAKKMGRTVALVAPEKHVGGMSVEGLGRTDIDNHPDFRNARAVGGLAREFYQRIAQAYGASGPHWDFEPHVAQRVIEQMLDEHDVPVYRNARLREQGGAEMSRNRLVAIHTEDGQTFRGNVFIDASIEGDLLHAAGVSTFIGREPNARYGETKNGIRGVDTYRQFTVRVDPYVVPGKPDSGLIPTIQDEPLGTPGEGDQRIQGYCFRFCFTDVASNRIPFTQPGDYDPGRYEIYRRYIAAGGKLWRPDFRLPNRKTDQNSAHDLSGNLYGMNHAYPGGSYAERQRILDEHASFMKGLFWFLVSDDAVPADLKQAWSAAGVCRDEFVDNEGWPRMFYVREARRLVSDLVMSERHTLRHNPIVEPDPVALSYWPPDTHFARRIVRDGAAYNEGFVFGGDTWGPFGISYRSLCPRPHECENLLTASCPSSTHIAYGAIRIEFTFMALGQATASAACIAADADGVVSRVPYARLRDQLLADGQVLS